MEEREHLGAVHKLRHPFLDHLQIGTIPGWFGSGLVGSGWVGSGRSNSDYKAISASQQSLSLGLAELGNGPPPI